MNSVKGKLLKKLKTVKTIGYLKPESILQQIKSPLIQIQAQEEEEEPKKFLETTAREKEPETIDVSELMRDLEDEETENLDSGADDKENIRSNLSSLKPKIESFGDKESQANDKRFKSNWSLLKPKIEFFGAKESQGDDKRFESNLSSLKPKPKVESFGANESQGDDKKFKSNWSSLKPKMELFGSKESQGDDKRFESNLSSLKPKVESFESKESQGGDKRFKLLSEIDVSSFRRPDLNSCTLFDPNLLAAFEQVVMAVRAQEAERMAMIEERLDQMIKEEEENQEPPLKSRKVDEISTNPLLEFGEKCPQEEEIIMAMTEESIDHIIKEEEEEEEEEEENQDLKSRKMEESSINPLVEFEEKYPQEADRMAMIEESLDHIIKEEEEGNQEDLQLEARRMEETSTNPLMEFEEKCPPGGLDSVILYTTGLRGIRKTFEDCQKIRFLLESFKVSFFERDVSMHREYKEELWRVVEGKVLPPRLFIKGRYIGGAEQVLVLHEQGKFKPLLEGIPFDVSKGNCDGCGGMRFVLCFRCNGSTRILDGDDNGGGGEAMKCLGCNENGLIVCPLCSLS